MKLALLKIVSFAAREFILRRKVTGRGCNIQELIPPILLILSKDNSPGDGPVWPHLSQMRRATGTGRQCRDQMQKISPRKNLKRHSFSREKKRDAFAKRGNFIRVED
ncbi:MAG: hypothetical protein ONB48_18625 [candidate division KSB1 bacterium]|nr:hypothetical protein [candidate division KSB1 bacterium]MDZ7276387.1 hypothetical protein [candidate division KSB1 bacterium]MDZ7287661.1 hypothetical protein [candidate division KSB1 bacterium]MDZ7299999.1 hypothetical protein [candidate division KSB1 bacterium]MDZ7309199.1 hypothetical protein [candidate division KSB1 bacterium]